MTKGHVVAGTLAVLLATCALAQPNKLGKLDKEGHPWWQHAVFYEIYPRSFADSNNDGLGDLNGITAHMDYLRNLGVDAIWITPCFPSPQVDFGYDVSDYTGIEPMYGTLADFDRLVQQGHKRQIRVVLDFVVNHSSDQHPWFLKSKTSRDNEYRDWYIWRDGKPADPTAPPPPAIANAPPGEAPPNNWTSNFGGPAWKYDPNTKQWFYHFFDPAQPDLNWRNPRVHDAMFNVVRFWLDRGVAGFRLDAVDTIFEDPQLRDNPAYFAPNQLDAAGNPLPGEVPHKDPYGMPLQRRIYNGNLPENHQVLQQLRQVADQYGAVLIGETWTENIAQLKQYYGQGAAAEIQLPMDFLFANVNRVSAPEFRRQVGLVESSGGWPVYLFSNHDIERAYNRYGGLHPSDEVAKLLAGLLLTLRGTPILYYGEEIGMENRDPVSREEVRDPIGVRGWPAEKGRDGERTPMQWTAGPNAGFTGGKPWLPIAANYQTHNVQSEEQDPNSVLNFYRAAIRLRHRDPALVEGSYVALNQQDQNVMSYLRQYRGRAVLVALNMSPEPQTVSFDLSAQGYSAKAKLRGLLISNAPKEQKLNSLTLQPYGVYVGEVVK